MEICPSSNTKGHVHHISPYVLGPTGAALSRVTVHGHSMFRLVDRPLSFRQRANEWIYKMLFLWSKEPAPDPRAGPWFAWFATAVILWRCRRRITKAILAASPLRLLRRRTAIIAPVKLRDSSTVTTITTRLKQPLLQAKQLNVPLPVHYHHRQQQLQQQQQQQQQDKYKSTTGIKTRVKRLCTGDGPHVSTSTSSIHANQQINYRVTRSGRVYGKYQNRTLAAEAH